MLTQVQIIILSVVITSVGSYIIYRIVLHYIREIEKRRTQQQDTRKAAFAISGNLVQEHGATQKITDNYRLTKILLGRGSSAEVFVGENVSNNHRYAIKVIDLSRKDIIWRYEREKNFLKDIEHSNAVRLFEVYNSPKQMFFVMELCTGGHLGHFLKKQPNGHLSELKAREYILQITRALMHCHEHGICHRDIKLQNILLENNSPDAQIKIVDFGNAVRFFGCTPLRKVVGTTYTAAPEVFRQSYDERCDVWSLGVVAYILLSGRRPFERVEIDQTPAPPGSPVSSKRRSSTTGLNTALNSPIAPLTPAKIQQILPSMYHASAEGSVIASILLGRYHFHHDAFKTISRESIYFIKTCMELDYTQRASAYDLLSHPWLRNEFEYFLLQQQERNNALNRSDSNMSRRFLSFPLITSNGAKTLIDSTARHFTNPTKTGMRDTSMLAVAFSMPVSQIKQIRSLFQAIDRNGNGLIEKEEFRAAMLQIQSELSGKDIELLFDSIDQNGDGSISFLEFVAAMIDPREVDIKQMNQAFKLLDKEGKGYLIKDDLIRVLCTESSEGFDLRKIPIEYHHNPALFFEKQSEMKKQKGSPKAKDNGTYAPPQGLTELEKEWQKEVQRHNQIREKVEKIFTVADLNGDGQLSYTEFLFAMAEGSLNLTSLDNQNEKLSTLPAPQMSGTAMLSTSNKQISAMSSAKNSRKHIKSASSLPRLSSRRQSDGELKHVVSTFRLRTPTFSQSNHLKQEEIRQKHRQNNRTFDLIWRYFGRKKNAIRVQPQNSATSGDIYVTSPEEWKADEYEPVDSLEDSPALHHHQYYPGDEEKEGTEDVEQGKRDLEYQISPATSPSDDVRKGKVRKTSTPSITPQTSPQRRKSGVSDKGGSSKKQGGGGGRKKLLTIDQAAPMLSQKSLTSPALLSSPKQGGTSIFRVSTNSDDDLEQQGHPAHMTPATEKTLSEVKMKPTTATAVQKEKDEGGAGRVEDGFENEEAVIVDEAEKGELHRRHPRFHRMKIDAEEDDDQDIVRNREQIDEFLESRTTLPANIQLPPLTSAPDQKEGVTSLTSSPPLKSTPLPPIRPSSIFRFSSASSSSVLPIDQMPLSSSNSASNLLLTPLSVPRPNHLSPQSRKKIEVIEERAYEELKDQMDIV